MLPLICYVVLALLIFVFRIVVQKHRTGDSGVRVSTQLATPLQKLATYLQMLVLLVVLVIVILVSLDKLQLHLDLGTPGKILGVSLCGVGTSIIMISQFQMGKSWRIGVDESEKTELVTHGMFSVSRNPIYFGMMIVGLGFVTLVPHYSMALCYVLAVVGINLQVRKIEEPHLSGVFGSEYVEYTKNVNRYIPWKK
ncbi:MAG: isoprenylcysteine carboxylmethyltransferase family protein [Gammaproteobacteria bacterium]|nr:isoprenylcysteine carboxylmethyltransferase family protein [Gammaproteobacteria bacterium]MDE0252693.1 isoprenylcysteine carboxylmethyltransferase family protein [Gammaproteobacteria bacterium]MDE0402381.1 isoprenylcysteine carboxylmethyltransferase family protein [Gammaproteobacteria bacterium]